jgi:hypothetical protein
VSANVPLVFFKLAEITRSGRLPLIGCLSFLSIFGLIKSTQTSDKKKETFVELSEVFNSDQILQFNLDQFEVASVYFAGPPFSSRVAIKPAIARFSTLLENHCGFSKSAKPLFGELVQGGDVQYTMFTLKDENKNCQVDGYEQVIVTKDFVDLNGGLYGGESHSFQLNKFRGQQRSKDLDIIAYLNFDKQNRIAGLTVVSKTRVRWFFHRWKLELEQKRDTNWEWKRLAQYNFALGIGLLN